MSNTKDPFVSIDETALENVSGGAGRVAAGSSSDSNDQLLTMLTSIGESIKDLGKNQNSGGDQMMQMMMMMLMMGGIGGGGGGGIIGGAAVAQPTYVDVSALAGYGGYGGGRCGKKGW